MVCMGSIMAVHRSTPYGPPVPMKSLHTLEYFKSARFAHQSLSRRSSPSRPCHILILEKHHIHNSPLGFGAATGVIGNLVLDIEALVKVSKWVAMSWLVMQAIADIVIATCMCLVLRHRRTGFRKTDSVIDRMILYTISTSLVTSVLSCILLGMVHFDNFHSVIMVILS